MPAPPRDDQELQAVLGELEKRRAYKIHQYFQDTGPYRRELYPKHLEFMRAGKEHNERLFLKANRVGGTEMGAYELTLHLTGAYDEYAPWWEGRRFQGPIKAWVAGDTSKTTRDIQQGKLLGPKDQLGTGMIPRHLIVHKTPKSGVPDGVENVYVRHVSGGTSLLQFKSYDQKREGFQGTEQHVVWLDEECPEDISTESLLRTTPTSDFEGGIILHTFTPLNGMTPLVLSYLPGGEIENAGTMPGRCVVVCTWDDVPHLTEQDKANYLRKVPAYQRDARTKGVPQLGSGAVFGFPESDIKVPDFPIPKHWKRGYGMDAGAGAHPTAAVWGALDTAADVLYLYNCYKRVSPEPAVHAAAIKAKGPWMQGVADCASLLVTQHDAEQLINIYKRLGLKIILPDKSVEAGIVEVWTRLSEGRLKVFASCMAWFEEFRLYRRDAKGRIVKERDDLMDATRYLCLSGLSRFLVPPREGQPVVSPSQRLEGARAGPPPKTHGWMR